MGEIQQNVFTELFGQSPIAKVLEFLVANRTNDFSISDMAKQSSVGRSTMHDILPIMLNEGLLIHTREVGKAKLFKINTESQRVKLLIKFYNELRRE